jgi:tape measure domain-containing protein
MNTLNFAFKRGILSARQFSDLFIKAPDLINTLGQNIGLTNKQMRDLANSGKFTTDLLINGLAKTNKHLNEMFDAKPETLLDAWHYVYNMIVRVGVIFSKHEKTIDRIAKGVKRFADTVYAAGKTIVDALGGVDAVLSLLESAFIAAFGIVTVNMIFAVIGAITALGTAAFAASLKAGAISLAFIGLVYAIEDLMVWMKGGDSVAGRFLGPFEDIGEKFDKLLAPFAALKEIFTGNVGEGWENLKKAIGEIDSKVVALGLVIVGIPAMFAAWNLIKFAGLLSTIATVTARILGIKTATKDTKEELDKLKQQSEEPAKKKGRRKKGEKEPTPTGTSSIPEVSQTETKGPKPKGLVGNIAKTAELGLLTAQLAADAGLLSDEQTSRVNSAVTGATIGGTVGNVIPALGPIIGAGVGAGLGYLLGGSGVTGAYHGTKDTVLGAINANEDSPLVNRNLKNLYRQKLDADKDKPIAVVPAPEMNDKPRGWASFAADAGAYANQYANGGRPPGAIMQLPEITITPPPNDINITNNVNVTATAELSELGPTITSEVNSAMTQVVNGITTKLNQANPVTEARAQ